MFTTVPVSVNSASGIHTSSGLAQLPASIEEVWVSDLTTAILEDIGLGRFVAQRHTFGSYSLVYRLDVQPAMLRRVALEHKYQYGTNTPAVTEMLELAKVWLTFNTDAAVNVSFTSTAPSLGLFG